MKNKVTHFLMVSLVCLLSVCVAVFTFLMVFMNRKSAETIDEVGAIYMSGMNEQKADHFETIINMYLSPVEKLAGSVSFENGDEEAMRSGLVFSGEEQGFESLAFFHENGTMEMLYGDPVFSLNPEPFAESLKNGSKKISAGTDFNGERVVLIGVPLEERVEACCDVIALVAAVPIEDISDILFGDEETSLLYSFIIRSDGSYVIRAYGQYRENYFDRVRELYDETDGKEPEEYVSELQAAMQNRESYSTVITMEGEEMHLYCASLPYSEWYLITVMSYGTLNRSVDNLSTWWFGMAIGGCVLILIATIIIFVKYFHLNQVQIQEVEAAKKNAERASKSKSEFLSNMSHDIRTPMNAIVGMTAIASANIDNKQQVENCLRKITLSSRHLLGLINDILDMSKIESGKITLNMERVSLREIMDGIVNIVQPQITARKQQFDVFIHDISSEYVYSDSVRLNQVLLNLLSNAIKFTPQEGSIQVTMYEEESPRGSEYVRICLQVKDTGIGMSEEFQGRIFESFIREDSARVHKTEGSGLGMAITKYIVDAMGGSIELRSKQGVGTEFNLTFDFENAAEQEEDMILPEWNMLVVDDDRQLCESAVQSLQSIGLKADWTLDGESAVDMVMTRHKTHQDYQIILLDWKLPGMDGIETAREIRRQLSADIPILLISAYDWSEIEEEAKAAGINGFISKPLFKSTLFYGLKPYVGTDDDSVYPGEKQADFGGKRILLAEDNELNWEIAEELLKEIGLELDWAENGKICVEKFQQSPPNFYDAVLMDIRMPEMTGYEATDAIRAMGREDSGIPIIAMTADAFSDDIQRCLEHGMNAHIAKPIDMKEVARILGKYLERD